jgi:hypothetical protein
MKKKRQRKTSKQMQKEILKGIRQCSKCKKKKSLSEFYKKSKSRSNDIESQCKQCKLKKRTDWRRNNPNYHRNWQLIKSFGINLEQYNCILKEQKYKCALCKRPASQFKRHLAVDHNHKTLFIRGLICDYCNYYLMRYFKDNKQLMIKMIDYLNCALKNDMGWE